MYYNNEITVLSSLLKEFIEDENVNKMFKFIDERMNSLNESGFEKWIQAELMRFLCKHENIPQEEVVKEEMYEYDKRKEKKYNNIRIDLTFRYRCKQYYIPVELKHCNNFCIDKVMSDLVRLSMVKKSQSKAYFRKVFSVLFHPYMNFNEISKELECDFSYEISGTNMVCTAFSEKL